MWQLSFCSITVQHRSAAEALLILPVVSSLSSLVLLLVGMFVLVVFVLLLLFVAVVVFVLSFGDRVESSGGLHQSEREL